MVISKLLQAAIAPDVDRGRPVSGSVTNIFRWAGADDMRIGIGFLGNGIAHRVVVMNVLLD
jgi:hypothetical protein